MQELTIFKNESFGEIRTQIIKGEPYFCLADACKILEIGNPSDVKSRLKKDGAVSIEVTSEGLSQSKFARKTQKMTFINESNLYKTIFQSRKPKAEQFTDWITSEVLPSIRKKGYYFAKWEQSRNSTKIVRKDLTDTIKEFIEYAEHQGCKAPNFYYQNFTKLVNKAISYVDSLRKINKNFRDECSPKQLGFVMTFEEMIKKSILEGMQAGAEYKDIYESVKVKCTVMSDLVGASKPEGITDREYYQALPKKYLLKGLSKDIDRLIENEKTYKQLDDYERGR